MQSFRKGDILLCVRLQLRHRWSLGKYLLATALICDQFLPRQRDPQSEPGVPVAAALGSDCQGGRGSGRPCTGGTKPGPPAGTGGDQAPPCGVSWNSWLWGALRVTLGSPWVITSEAGTHPPAALAVPPSLLHPHPRLHISLELTLIFNTTCQLKSFTSPSMKELTASLAEKGYRKLGHHETEAVKSGLVASQPG